PLTALRRLHQVTGEVAVIETAAIAVHGQEDRPFLEFIPGMEVNRDPTNWFLPTEAAAHALVQVAGFRSVETVARAFFSSDRPGVTDFRLTLHARPHG
ncbi:MAG: hypothetical protein LC792_14510, partial [Actinobacteria bacterium]|nr:hypothetical protein [Actinomycetota bacterium]